MMYFWLMNKILPFTNKAQLSIIHSDVKTDISDQIDCNLVFDRSLSLFLSMPREFDDYF